MRNIINHIDQVLRPNTWKERQNETQRAHEAAIAKAEEEHAEKEALAQTLNDWLSTPMGQYVRNKIEKDKEAAIKSMIDEDEDKRSNGRTKYLIADAVEEYLASILRDYKKSQLTQMTRG